MTLRAASGCSEALEDSRAAGREAAEEALARLGGAVEPGQTAVLCFVSIAFDVAEVVRGVRAVIDAPVVGCTTFSEMTDRGFVADSVALLVVTGVAVGWAVVEGFSRDVDAAARAAWEEARAMLGDAPPRVLLAFPDAALTHDGERVTEALHAATRGAVPLAGGASGDGGRFQKTWQIAGDAVYSGALVVLALGGAFEARVITRTGWSPLADPAVATEAERNVLLRVDGVPAAEYVQRFTSSLAPTVIGTFPIARVDQSATADGRTHHVIRSPFFHDPATGGLVLAGRVARGERIQLGRNALDDVLASADEAARTLRAACGPEAPAAVFAASCGARRLMLGHVTGREAEAITAAFGDAVPMAGFYSYGEIGAFDSGDARLATPRYHNCTLVLCALTGRAG